MKKKTIILTGIVAITSGMIARTLMTTKKKTNEEIYENPFLIENFAELVNVNNTTKIKSEKVISKDNDKYRLIITFTSTSDNSSDSFFSFSRFLDDSEIEKLETVLRKAVKKDAKRVQNTELELLKNKDTQVSYTIINGTTYVFSKPIFDQIVDVDVCKLSLLICTNML